MRGLSCSILAATAFFVAGVPWGTTAAQEKISAGDVMKAARKALANAQSSSSEIEELRQALRGPDPSVRAAVFTAMVESNNPTLTTIAINEGRAHSDVVLQDLSARAAFREVNHLSLEPTGDQSERASWKTLVKWTGTPIVYRYDWATGNFNLGNKSSPGRISGTTLSFKYRYCSGTLTSEKHSWTYSGRVRCVGGRENFVENAKIRIR